MNFPNSITVIRIVLGMALPFLLVQESFEIRILAMVVFGIACFSDWLDGWYARKYKLVTTIGKILDPIADKIMVIGAFFTFAYMGMYSIWLIVPIALRELVITIYRLIFLRDGKVVAAVKSGKAKTAVQMGTLGFLYVHFMYKFHYKATGDYTFVEWFFPEGIMYFLLFLSVALTLYSGYRFFIKNWKLVQQANERYLYV